MLFCKIIVLKASDLKTGILGLTFELMECNLYELLSRKTMIITEDIAKNLFYQIMKALEFTHAKGIFHRDIKPEVNSRGL